MVPAFRVGIIKYIFLKRIALHDTIILKVIIAHTKFLSVPNHINTSKHTSLQVN